MVEDDGTIKEIHKVIGGPCDGIYVNQRFEKSIEGHLGKTRASKLPKAVFIRLALFHERILGEKTGKTNPKQWFDD